MEEESWQSHDVRYCIIAQEVPREGAEYRRKIRTAPAGNPFAVSRSFRSLVVVVAPPQNGRALPSAAAEIWSPESRPVGELYRAAVADSSPRFRLVLCFGGSQRSVPAAACKEVALSH